MIKTASLENSKRLYELATEWNDTEFVWVESNKYGVGESFIRKRIPAITHDIPAPDLDWLLNKLPRHINYPKKKDSCALFIEAWVNDPEKWWAGYSFWEVPLRSSALGYKADTPADVACLLLIKLFEQGVVKV